MIRKLTIITGNKDKAAQLQDYLKMPVQCQTIDIEEIQSLDVVEVVKHKARLAYETLKTPVLVDDVGLQIDCLGKLPGALIKYFILELGTGGIAELVRHYATKRALATVALGYGDTNGIKVFVGQIEGEIAEVPKGKNGFGWDEIFIPKGYTMTRAEMAKKDYVATSPRMKAVKKLGNYLSKN